MTIYTVSSDLVISKETFQNAKHWESGVQLDSVWTLPILEELIECELMNCHLEHFDPTAFVQAEMAENVPQKLNKLMNFYLDAMLEPAVLNSVQGAGYRRYFLLKKRWLRLTPKTQLKALNFLRDQLQKPEVQVDRMHYMWYCGSLKHYLDIPSGESWRYDALRGYTDTEVDALFSGELFTFPDDAGFYDFDLKNFYRVVNGVMHGRPGSRFPSSVKSPEKVSRFILSPGAPVHVINDEALLQHIVPDKNLVDHLHGTLLDDSSGTLSLGNLPLGRFRLDTGSAVNVLSVEQLEQHEFVVEAAEDEHRVWLDSQVIMRAVPDNDRTLVIETSYDIPTPADFDQVTEKQRQEIMHVHEVYGHIISAEQIKQMVDTPVSIANMRRLLADCETCKRVDGGFLHM